MISIYYPPYAFGGDAIYVHRLAKELVRQGHEVDVVHQDQNEVSIDSFEVMDESALDLAISTSCSWIAANVELIDFK